jgi:phosphatidylinositol 3-kinase
MLSTDPHLWRTYDPDAWRENPVEIKHRKLLRSQRLGDEGRDLKPGPADRDRLNEIFKLPPTASLNPADKDLLWKFRFSLFRSPRSLTKFLKCVTWSDPVEAKQAVEKLLPLWGQEIGVDDALELLGPGFTDRRVRAFAVRRLERADDEVSAACTWISFLESESETESGRNSCCTCCSWYKLSGSTPPHGPKPPGRGRIAGEIR